MITAIIMINVERPSIGKVMDHLLTLDGVSEVYPVAGEYDIVAIVRTQTSGLLSKIVADIMPHNIPEILHTKTLIALGAKSKVDLSKVFNLDS